MAEEPIERVYRGRENTGAAYLIPQGHAMDLSPTLNYYAQQAKLKKQSQDDEIAGIDKLGSELGKAWSIDFPELQKDYEGIVEKLKDHEKKPTKDKWASIQMDMGMLKNKIHRSQNAEKQFIGYSNRVANDKMGLYDYEAVLEELQGYQDKDILNRPDVPNIKAATTQSYVEYIRDNTKYAPTTKAVKYVNKDGTYTSHNHTVVEEDKLKEQIRTTYQQMPDNLKNIAKRQKQSDMMQNPNWKYMTPQEQDKAYEDMVVESSYNAVYEGLKKKDATVVSDKQVGNQGLNLNLGGASAETGKAIYTVEKVDADGNYKVHIADKSKSGLPGDNKVIGWQGSGAEYKEITGDKNSPVPDDAVMIIPGRLKYVMVNKDENMAPTIGIQYDEVSGKAAMWDDAKRAYVTVPGFKQGQVFEIPYRIANASQVLEYGADPYEVFTKKQAEADKIYSKPVTGQAKMKGNLYEDKKTKASFSKKGEQAPPGSKGSLY